MEGQVVQLITENHEDNRNTKNRIRRAVYVELEALPAVDRRGMTRLGSRFPDIRNRSHDMTRKTLKKLKEKAREEENWILGLTRD